MKKKNPLSMHIDVDDLIPESKPLSAADFAAASDEEKQYMVQMRPSTTFFKDGVKRLWKNKIAVISFFIIVIVTLTSIILPMFWPYT